MNREIYTYKGKLYEIEARSKHKHNGLWIDTICYRCLYYNPDGQTWSRTKEEFFSLFEKVIS